MSVDGFHGSFYTRSFGPLPNGVGHGGHKHPVDHLTFIAKGRVRLEETDEHGNTTIQEIEAPSFLFMPAKHTHRFTAIMEGTMWYCIFALAEVDRARVDVAMAALKMRGVEIPELEPGATEIPYHAILPEA